MAFGWNTVTEGLEEAIFSCTFPATDDNLTSAQEFVLKIAEAAGISMKKSFTLDTVIEEMFLNVSHYAYPDSNGDITVSCFHDGSSDLLHLLLEDSGIPFDPCKRDEAAAKANVDNMIPGGLGILMVRKLTKTMEYERKKDKNRVYLAFLLR